VVGRSNKEGVRDTRKKMKTLRKRYVVVRGVVKRSVYTDGFYSIVRTDNKNEEETIKRLNSNKSLHTVVTTGTVKKAKRVVKEM
jgi:molybdopterin biosynthesis enzyme MoaB